MDRRCGKVDNSLRMVSLASRGKGTDLEQSFRHAVSTFETQLLQQALEAAQYNQRKAAQRLGLTYHQFRGLYRKYRDALSA